LAVAYGGTNISATGNAQNPTLNITVSGTNPVLVQCVGLDSTTATVTGLSWSLGSGTTVDVRSVRSGTAFCDVWAIPAPSAGAGTVTINKSAASINHQLDVILYTGADQTTPCPSGDAVTSTTTASTQTLTPTNLGASDGSAGNGINTVSNNPNGVTPNQRYLNATTSINMQTGDATGTTGVTLKYNSPDIGAGSVGKVVVRIQVPTGGGGGGPTGTILLVPGHLQGGGQLDSMAGNFQ